MNSQTYRVGFIGAGKLAGSVIRGLVRARYCAPGEMMASEPSEETRAALRKDVDIVLTAENAEVAEKAATILLGVKPSMVLPVLGEIASRIDDKLVISLAAGVRISSMEKLANARFMRAITNTPSTICQAATAIARGSRTTGEDVDLARNIFGAIGVVADVTDDQIDIVTALCGSGPAFVYTVIEALAKGAEKMGLTAGTALRLATQTALGATQLARESKLSPEELRQMVVTPGGTTAAGLAEMEKRGTADSLMAAVEAATRRGKEMAQENV
jgi:pyrroline-5-carboxylate reductase